MCLCYLCRTTQSMPHHTLSLSPRFTLLAIAADLSLLCYYRLITFRYAQCVFYYSTLRQTAQHSQRGVHEPTTSEWYCISIRVSGILIVMALACDYFMILEDFILEGISHIQLRTHEFPESYLTDFKSYPMLRPKIKFESRVLEVYGTPAVLFSLHRMSQSLFAE